MRSIRADYDIIGKGVSFTTTGSTDDEFDGATAKCEQPSIVEKTAIEDARFVQTDDNKEKLRERFTLDATLNRYARWGRIRMDFFNYGSLIMVSQLYLALSNVLNTTAQLKSRQGVEWQTPMCWCDNTMPLNIIHNYLDEIRPKTNKYVMKTGFIVIGFSSVFWERYFGRRSALLVAQSLSIICTVLIHQRDYTSLLTRSIAWTVEYWMSGAVLLISFTSFMEVLPSKWRVVGAGIYTLASTFAEWWALTSIHLIPNIDFLRKLVKESISHLIVQGKYSEVDDILCAEEVELNLKKSNKSVEDSPHEKTATGGSTEGEISRELKKARMITDDLAYRDDDDYTPFEFIRKLPHSDVFFLLCAGFAIAALSGLMDRMTIVYLGQSYVDGEILMFSKFLIKTVAGIVLMVYRKQMASLSHSDLSTCDRSVDYDCATNHEDQKVFAMVCIFVFHLTVEMLKALSLLYVAELTPSMLRTSAVTLVIFINSMSRELSDDWSSQDIYKTILMCIGVTAILCLMLRKKVTHSPEIFCIYLNDLVPKPRELEVDSTIEDDEENRLSDRDIGFG